MVTGIIVRDGPVKCFSQRGTPWTQATILVERYDGRQKKERERPAFVRLVAFNERPSCSTPSRRGTGCTLPAGW